jgi:hypothetical protein
MGVKHVEAFGDSLLVVQQIAGTFQCLDGSLNAYLDKCLEIIALFDDFTIQHVSKDKNTVANDLAQEASGFQPNRENFSFLEKTDVSVCQTRQSSFWLMCSATIYFVGSRSAKLDSLVSKTGGSKISRILDKSSKTMTAGSDDWRTPLVRYLDNLDHIVDRKVRRQALKYVMLDNTLYCRTIDGLLLKCLGSDQSKIPMGEVHDDICGTH